MKTVEEVTKLAAEWWSDKVCHPKFDNGDSSQTGGMTMMMAMLCTKPVQNDSKQLFTDILAKKIIPVLESIDRDVILSVDYGPDRMLHDAAQEADIPSTNFPWKTTMWITNHHVAVRYGYRAPIEYLYMDIDYCEQQIERHKQSIAHYRDESYFSFYEDVEYRKKQMREGETEAIEQLELWEKRKAGFGCSKSK